jgi:hypothetical protein
MDGFAAARAMRLIESESTAAGRTRRRARTVIVAVSAAVHGDAPEIDSWLVKGQFRLQEVGEMLEAMQSEMRSDGPGG